MKIEEFPLTPPSLDEIVDVLKPVLESNYNESSISVADCPDLRQAPYHLAARGLSGRECIADIGGPTNLFPDPILDARYSLTECARQMGMSQSNGMMVGAGAGPFFQINSNAELASNFSWEGAFDDVTNMSYYTKISKESGGPICDKSPSTDGALILNLYASDALPGPVLKISARGRKGSEKSFTECVRKALTKKYGDDRAVSMGGVFLVKKGKANYHVMPDFPSKPQGQAHTFRDPAHLNDWLTYHHFDSNSQSPIICVTAFHSADPGKQMGVRLEHTHCFTVDGSNRGGHYHNDIEEDVEYEAYFNTAKAVYRIERPEATLEKDLHDD